MGAALPPKVAPDRGQLLLSLCLLNSLPKNTSNEDVSPVYQVGRVSSITLNLLSGRECRRIFHESSSVIAIPIQEQGYSMRKRKKSVIILMADDDPDDRLLTQEALEESRLTNRLYFVEDGEDLLDYLFRRGKYSDIKSSPRPGIILLDLNMPKKDGREALKEIKADPNLRQIPIVVLTTSKAEDDIYRSYDLGANSFITKPATFESLVEVMKNVGKYWFEIVELPPEKYGA
jgi:CheY-like chemotaxis protein